MAESPTEERFELFTTSYPKFSPAMGVPVQASNGRPRYTLSYPLQYIARPLYPNMSWMKLPVDEFRRRYWEYLDGVGVENIRDLFAAIADHSGEKKIVLMCFEKSVGDCHRGDFAMWWTEKTGEAVTEVG